MDNYDQAYDNYGGSQGGGGSTKSCTPRQRLVWQSIAWAFFLTGEAALFALWFSWGCGAHNDPWAPMFNVYPKYNLKGFVFSIAPAQMCTKTDNTWKDSSVDWTCRTWGLDEATSVKKYFDDTYGPLVTSKGLSLNPSPQEEFSSATARVRAATLKQANKFWAIRWIGLVFFIIPFLWFVVTVVAFLANKKRRHSTKRPSTVKAGKSGGCCHGSCCGPLDVWFWMWFIPPLLITIFWIIAAGFIDTISNLKKTIQDDAKMNFYYNAEFGPAFWIPFAGVLFSLVVLFAAFFSWHGYQKQVDK